MKDFSRNSDRKMYDAVCDDCGKACKVPFLPSGEKPIYCSECFSKHGGGESDRFSGSRRDGQRFDRPSRDYSNPSTPDNSALLKELFGSLDKKLDQVIKLLTIISEKKTHRIKKDEE